MSAFLRARERTALEPDRNGTLVTIPNDTQPIVAAWTAARDLALAYFPVGSWTSRELSLNLRAFPRPIVLETR